MSKSFVNRSVIPIFVLTILILIMYGMLFSSKITVHAEEEPPQQTETTYPNTEPISQEQSKQNTDTDSNTDSPVSAKASTAAVQEAPSNSAVNTTLELTGPNAENVVYTGDPVVVNAKLTNTAGIGISNKRITVTAYQNYQRTQTYYGSTDASGIAAIDLTDLEEGNYTVYAEFVGDASEWGGNVYLQSESDSLHLTVKAAADKPNDQKNPTSEDTKTTQIPTTVSIQVQREMEQSRYFDIYVTVVDKEGKPVLEDVKNNIELYLNGEKRDTYHLDEDEGNKNISYHIPDNGQYEIYVKYIGKNNYASSESQHIILNVETAAYTALEHVDAKNPTVSETGNIEYWYEPNEKTYFSDKDGKNEITLNDTILAKLPPEIIEGLNQKAIENEKSSLYFRSNAAFRDFIRVEIDGNPLDDSQYTVQPGSVAVTLNENYVASLPAGIHTIGIVSDSGTAKTTFTISKKAEESSTSSPSSEPTKPIEGTNVHDDSLKGVETADTHSKHSNFNIKDAVVTEKSEKTISSESPTLSNKQLDDAESSNQNAPQTGHENKIVHWIGLLLFSIFISNIFYKKIKQE